MPSAPAATRAGCWCRYCATWGWPPALSPAIWCSSPPMSRRWMAHPGRRPTSPICTPGPRCTCPAPAGWASIPTSGLFAGEGHIPLACTPDPISAAPVTGATDKCEVLAFDYANSVQRIHEDPRVTKPYTDEQWAAIDALGQPGGRSA